MKAFLGGLVGAAALILLAGCSGKQETNSRCGTASACGGNIVGTWHIVASCINADTSSMTQNSSCPEEMESSSGLKTTGSVTYAADLTYTVSFSVTGTIVLRQPTSCLGAGVTCAQLQAGFQSNLGADGFSSASCADSGGICSCTLALSPATKTETGTYSTTSAGVLTETPTGSSSPDNADYCVSGNQLTLSPHRDSTMATMAGATTSTSTITLTK